MSKKFVFSSETCRLAEVRAEVRAFLQECRVPEDEAEMIVLALDEACANVIRHAYHHSCKPVRLEMKRVGNCVRFVLRDYGTPCDPKKIRSRALEDIRPGGLGVHIIRQAFDRVDYAPQPRGTRLTLEKRIV